MLACTVEISDSIWERWKCNAHPVIKCVDSFRSGAGIRVCFFLISSYACYNIHLTTVNESYSLWEKNLKELLSPFPLCLLEARTKIPDPPLGPVTRKCIHVHVVCMHVAQAKIKPALKIWLQRTRFHNNNHCKGMSSEILYLIPSGIHCSSRNPEKGWFWSAIRRDSTQSLMAEKILYPRHKRY